MTQYIPKSALVAEIERRKKIHFNDYHINGNNSPADYGACNALTQILSFIDTLEVKEVDLEQEYKEFVEEDPVYNKLVNGIVGKAIAKHFFELGVRVNNPITAADRGMAEEIIINLKMLEKDYRIVLTREIEWLRNKAQKGEKV